MKLIKIKSGTYGQREGNRLRVKNAKSEPFYVEDAEAERLEKLSSITIEIVTEPTAAESEPKGSAGGDEMRAALEAELKDFKRDELDAIAAEMGIDTSTFSNKAACIEAIVNAELEGAELPDWAQEEAVDDEL